MLTDIDGKAEMIQSALMHENNFKPLEYVCKSALGSDLIFVSFYSQRLSFLFGDHNHVILTFILLLQHFWHSY